jgi:iodotyrosine deiodinase
MNASNFPVISYEKDFIPAEEMQHLSTAVLKNYETRRSVRSFSDKAIPNAVLENLILAASTAPSGANKQPWTFCIITNPELKKEIRIAAEKEEFESYNGRMPEEWLKDLAHLGTDWHKPFLEIAPALIIVFKRSFEFGEHNEKRNNYYVTESVGLACGFLLTAIHQCGLVALTHTPSPMQFLSKILKRPDNEKPFLLIPIGYPADYCEVPDISRKPLENICQWYK